MTADQRRRAEGDPIQEYVKRVAAAAPPLSPAQQDRLAILLRPDPASAADRQRKAS
jgi:hypothetical protein